MLVVDDSVETIELIKRNLEAASFRIYTAHQVQSAIAILSSVDIDLVITDLKMPEQNGMQLVRHVSENYKNIGILVITGFPSRAGGAFYKNRRRGIPGKTFTRRRAFNSVERVLSKTAKGRKKNTKIDAHAFGIIGASSPCSKCFKPFRPKPPMPPY